MSPRYQLPAWSPLRLGAILGSIAPRRGAVDALAQALRDEYGAASVELTASGTVALAMAFLASAEPGVRPRIALPAWGCPDLMTAADSVGAQVVLYDVVPESLAPDGASLRQALETGPHAVVVAHWFGLPVDTAALARQVSDAGSVLIDDAAQATGARTPQGPCGASGGFGILSFGRGKGRTGGKGGAVLANTAQAVERLKRVSGSLGASRSGLADVGRLGAQWALGRPSIYGIPAGIPSLRLGETIYHPLAELRRMAPRAAEVVLRMDQAVRAESEGRRRRAAEWAERIRSVPGVTGYAATAGSTPGWLRFPVRVDDEYLRSWSSIDARRLGVMPGYPSTLDALSVVRDRLLTRAGSFPGAARISQSLFTLPTHHWVSDRDVFAVERRLLSRQ